MDNMELKNIDELEEDYEVVRIPQIDSFKRWHGGFIAFPKVFVGRMALDYYKAIQPKEKADDYQNTDRQKNWRGALALLKGYGKIAIPNIAPADINNDALNMPVALVEFISTCALLYINEQIDLKNWVGGLSSFAKTKNEAK